jgi:hypothetical protein
VSQLELKGTELRDAGVESVTEHTPGYWRSACDRAILEFARKREPFTAEDVRRIVGDPPNHPNAMGARFLEAVRSGVIRRVDRATPARPSRHASSFSLWVGVAPEQLEIAGTSDSTWLDRLWGALCDEDGKPWPWDAGEPTRPASVLDGPVCCAHCSRG